MITINRREFMAGAFAVAGAGTIVDMKGAVMGKQQIMTVEGPIDREVAGTFLPHEHMMVDFIGASEVSRDRYDQQQVFETVLPYLQQAKNLGVTVVAECTPAYLGRDVELLNRLAKASGVKLITNTGYYGAGDDKYVPDHAYEETADQLARRWIREWVEGIEDTGIRPGFIKIGVDAGRLSEIDKKLVVAAAKTHLATGLTIAAHTGDGTAALDELATLAENGVDASAFIWVHAQIETDTDIHRRAGEKGAWVEFDGLGPRSVDRHVALVQDMGKRGLLDRVLVSHDAGWYNVGEPRGGTFRMFDTLFEKAIPAMEQAGITDRQILQLTHNNPVAAFSIRIRTC